MKTLESAALEAMHTLLHVDAPMSERVESAKAIAAALGHPWPPYEADPDRALSESDLDEACPFHSAGNQGRCSHCEEA